MQSTLNRPVAFAVTEARLRTARGRAHAARHRARPGPVRRSAAVAALRVAQRLDADAARRPRLPA
ncbi:MAG: hypothetical protein QOE86_611 [Solirubrobacteraceae bacterium]|jgi:hypothetical protein|nr:hypothetical protein [Solirubrobacteraceae bacterium]